MPAKKADKEAQAEAILTVVVSLKKGRRQLQELKHFFEVSFHQIGASVMHHLVFHTRI